MRSVHPRAPNRCPADLIARAIMSAVGVSDGCSAEANSASHRASLPIGWASKSCVLACMSHLLSLWSCRRDHRHGQAPWPGPRSGPAGRRKDLVPGPPAPDPVPVNADALHCFLLASRHVRAGEKGAGRRLDWFCDDGTSRCRSGRQPKVYLPGGIFRGRPWHQGAIVTGSGCTARGPGPVPVPARRPRCGSLRRACPGCG